MNGPYVVLIEHDHKMWEFALYHNWRWVCRLAVWWNTRPDGKWRSRNVEIHP